MLPNPNSHGNLLQTAFSPNLLAHIFWTDTEVQGWPGMMGSKYKATVKNLPKRIQLPTLETPPLNLKDFVDSAQHFCSGMRICSLDNNQRWCLNNYQPWC